MGARKRLGTPLTDPLTCKLLLCRWCARWVGSVPLHALNAGGDAWAAAAVAAFSAVGSSVRSVRCVLVLELLWAALVIECVPCFVLMLLE
jgi:hypothetical protein